MAEIEVPQYFICPISLQIMKDPVTTMTGITYDRESIEQWLFINENTTCPITRQHLPKDSDLTPNHTLLRLIQAWCTQNGVHRFPTPKSSLNKFQVLKILKDLKDPNLQLMKIMELKFLASQNERNKKCLLQAGVSNAMILFLLTCFRKGQFDKGVEEALSLLELFDVPEEKIKVLLEENDQILDNLTWVLGCEVEKYSVAVKSHAVMLLNTIVQKASSKVMERLKPQMFETIVKILRCGTTQQGMKTALHVMVKACHWGRNRVLMVESGAVFELIEIELLGTREKSTTELTMEILFHLCSCADGRAQFVNHKGAIALLTERIFTVSKAVDGRIVLILSLVLSTFSATRAVVEEMAELGTVSKLCRLVHHSDDHGTYLKDKAREILGSHANVWKYSPCISDHVIRTFTRS
ncbi:unnamed protein product [Sphenostylis stenocarpa]|uniref:U-box domain-containing protein n=1 Tax=Sphenostylis stenocarpa TaxID=92480 RepID=A0AA86VW37_9FABA|nr:unnamed protein product [Sphenostylis stenocarpa]